MVICSHRCARACPKLSRRTLFQSPRRRSASSSVYLTEVLQRNTGRLASRIKLEPRQHAAAHDCAVNQLSVHQVRWDEKAGLPAGCVRLPIETHLRVQKETGYEEGYQQQ